MLGYEVSLFYFQRFFYLLAAYCFHYFLICSVLNTTSFFRQYSVHITDKMLWIPVVFLINVPSCRWPFTTGICLSHFRISEDGQMFIWSIFSRITPGFYINFSAIEWVNHLIIRRKKTEVVFDITAFNCKEKND